MYQSGSTPSDMLDKLSVEIEAKRQLAKEVLPKELESVQRYVQDLQEVEAQPTVGPDLLEKINGRIGTINREINTVVEKKMLREDSTDDKLALFKQNVSLNTLVYIVSSLKLMSCYVMCTSLYRERRQV